jgi:pyruvate kinase
LKIRKYLKEIGNEKIKIISKIERPSAVENIDSIIDVSDGIMVARGDLGVEIPVHKVPRIQKEIVKKANKQGIYSIIATQMLESMTLNSRPTRAETNDVYNAVIDGADAVMLSGETSVGVDPVNVVRTMDQIVYEAEKNIPRFDSHEYSSGKPKLIETFGHFSFTLSNIFKENNWKGKIIITSQSGYTALMVSKFRAPLDIIVLTTSDRVVNETSLLWGVRAVKIQTKPTGDEAFELNAIKECQDRKLLDEDDTHVAVIKSSYLSPTMGNSLSIYDLKKINELKK